MTADRQPFGRQTAFAQLDRLFNCLHLRKSGMGAAGRHSLLIVAVFSLFFMMGCQQSAPTTQPSSAYDRSENALKDPFNYSPGIEKPDMGDGVGGNLNGLKKDWDYVINP